MMVGPASNQKRKDEEKKLQEKPVIKKVSPQERALAEINSRATQKIDAGKLVAEFLSPDFLKQGIRPSGISALLKNNVVPTKAGLTFEQAEMRVARSYVRDNLLNYIPSDIKPSQKEIERSMGAVTKFVCDISNSKSEKVTKKIV